MSKFNMKALLGDLVGDCRALYLQRQNEDIGFTHKDLRISESE